MKAALTLGLAVGALVALGGCKKQRPNPISWVWLGPAGGCVELPNGVGCWGPGEPGQLGGETTARLAVSKVELKEGKLHDVALGPHHACAIFEKRSVACWGEAKSPVSTLEGAEAILAGASHTCVRAGTKLRCFGSNAEGQLGPFESEGGPEVSAFALGDAHTCVLSAGRVLCFGRNTAAPPGPLLEGAAITALAAGGDHTCALARDRTVRCWGRNDAGQLGDGTRLDTLAPAEVAGLRYVEAIAVGARHSCAKLPNHAVVCWGANDHHQLANGTTDSSTHPIAVIGLLGVEQLVCSGDATCARLGDGSMRCWGANGRGQLGDGTTVEHDVPMPPKFVAR